MSKTLQVGPLALDIRPDEVVLRFLAPEETYLAVPPFLEQELAALAAGDPEAFDGKTVVFDLTGLRGLSSRHLGILVTAHKAFRSRGGCALRGASVELRRLLEVTQIIRLFSLEKS